MCARIPRCSCEDMAAKKVTISMLIPVRIVQRSCVWFCWKEGSSATETYRQMQFVFRRKCYSRRSVFRWHKDFAKGHQKLGDLLCPGAPKSVQTPQKIDQCKQLVMANRRLGVHQLSSSLSISYGTTLTILHKELSLDKKAAKMIPHKLSAVDIRKRLEFCTNFVSVYGASPRGINWILTMDKSWFHVYDPKSKVENMHWLSKGEERPQIVRREMSVKKIMFIPFFDAKGLVHFEFFKNQTITKEVFLHLLLRVRDSLRAHHGSRVWLQRRGYHLHMDNAPAHRSDIVQRTLDFMEWPQLKQPPYSPDLSPCDFFLFPLLKRNLHGHNFQTTAALHQAVLDEISAVPSIQWKRCFRQWIERCRKCLAFGGDYFEGRKVKP